MELIVLGSSGAIPTKERNLPAIALKLDFNSETILFDCGEDVQRRFVDGELKFNKPLVILISHFHGDHIIGLPGLLFRFGLQGRNAPVTIIGPTSLFAYLFFHKKVIGLNPNYPFKIIEINHDTNLLREYDGLDSDEPEEERVIEGAEVYETSRYTIDYTPVDHSVITYAYAFIEKPRRGKFYPERAKELGIPMSNIWKKLHEGKTIEFEGKEIDPEAEGIVGPKRRGRKITYSGDCSPCESLINLGKDSDLLIHEATYSLEFADLARERKHSTAADAAKDAKEMNAKQLLLTHISSRFTEDAVELLNEAKKVFPKSILAKDLLRIEIK